MAFHPNSLVDPATHSPALLKLIGLKISRPFIGMSLLSLPTLQPPLHPAQNIS
jgi:hypothetical protein